MYFIFKKGISTVMDRKTILFVICFTLSIFCVNLYFDREHDEKLRDWQKLRDMRIEQNQQQLVSEVAARTATHEELPIVEIYADSNGYQVLTSGTRVNSNVFVLPWNTNLPNEVFVRKAASHDKLEKLLLNSTQEDSALPVLYSADKKTAVRVGDLNTQGNYDLQLISPAKNSSFTELSLAYFNQNQFSIPLEAPESDAIALLKTGDEYLPVGYYDSSTKLFKSLVSQSAFSELLQKEKPKVQVTSQDKEERLYVLENDYQQLVFSNLGGALVEINLPFETKENTHSIVREIEFDRMMKEQSPENALFPLGPYLTPGENADDSYIEHSVSKLGGYYPLLRRKSIDQNTMKASKAHPSTYALNIVSDYPEVAELVYDVKSFASDHITFESVQPHRRITKTFTLANGNEGAPYCVDLSIKLNKSRGDSRPLWLTTGTPEIEMLSGASTPTLQYRVTRLGKPEVESISLPSNNLTVSSIQPDWLCNSNGFLGFIIDPVTEAGMGYKAEFVPGTSVPSRLAILGQKHGNFKAEDLPGYNMMLPLRQDGGSMNFRFFAGPLAESTLKAVDNMFADPTSGYTPDYISTKGFHGWFSFITEPFAKLLFYVMKQAYDFTGSWPLSIIILTVFLRVFLYPLNRTAMRSMRKSAKIQPQIAALQAKHKKDPQKAQIETMKLMRKEGANPMMGCLPLLIQMPFFIAMFDLLKSTFELRGASAVPGWIDNLTAPDVAFDWGVHVFFFGSQLHLLPLVLGGLMFVQQKLTTPSNGNSSGVLTEQQQQQKMMGKIMPVAMIFLFYNFASGLNIYWISSTILGIIQQWFTNKDIDNETNTPESKEIISSEKKRKKKL
ncbi:MAG: YidC/Oxa1 family membrane protein insertase [Halioglobus sp.]